MRYLSNLVAMAQKKVPNIKRIILAFFLILLTKRKLVKINSSGEIKVKKC